MTDIEIPIKMGAAGRAVIPQNIRDTMRIEVGDYLLIKIEKVIKRTEEKEASA
jgi:bifunctional DNA-binding transcriptional regulator/antitoxin component of YhaV-PrlF toxin-antitoxin module